MPLTRGEKGALGAKYMDRTNPMDKQRQVMVDLRGFETAPPTAQFFGNAGREHMRTTAASSSRPRSPRARPPA